jgi:hypothetical protein
LLILATSLKSDKKDDKIFVFYAENDKVNVSDLQNYGKQCQKAEVNHAIIIIKNIMTPMAKKAISEISGNAQLECFEEKEL